MFLLYLWTSWIILWFHHQWIKFDSHTEEKAVELFASNIMKAGDAFYQNPMDTPFIPTWSRVKSAIPDFLIRLEKAVELFSSNIIRAGEDFYLNPMDAPFIPTWSRVKSAIPDFLVRLEKAVNEDNRHYL